eukprot:GILJ01017777.1.p1 GENE.GILJ01017777.1~~GILJ01017777.1.p1  ORF type:complete len:492 (-),score=79.56 GILJ01017777.1:28-1359(-)
MSPLSAGLASPSSPTNRRGSMRLPQIAARKKIHWQTLPANKLNSTLWCNDLVSVDSVSVLDITELDRLFAVDNNENKRKGQGRDIKTVLTKSKASTVSLLESKRSHNVEIALSRFQMTYSGIRDAIVNMDEDALTLDDLWSLMALVPTKQEMEPILAYTGEVDKLGKAERFFIEMYKVPRLKQRIEAFIFKRQFNNKIEEIDQDLTTIQKATDQVRDSVRFQSLLQYILYVGNYLNQGSGQPARGISLSSLDKLTDVKANDKKQTILHFLINCFEKSKPELLNFAEDITDVQFAKTVDLEGIAAEVRELENGMKVVQRELQTDATPKAENGDVQPADTVQDTFKQSMDVFASRAQALLSSLSDRLAKLRADFSACKKFYAEDDSVKTEPFFNRISIFIHSFESVKKERAEVLEKELKKKQREERESISPPVRHRRALTVSGPV